MSFSSPQFQMLLEEARDTLPRHFRGEYGAKLALRDPATGGPVLAHPNTADAVRSYFAQKDRADEWIRKKLLEAVHPLKRKEPLACTDCHRREGSLVDFAAVGYPKARIDALTAPVVFQMVEHLRKGETFTMPNLSGTQAATSQPSTQP